MRTKVTVGLFGLISLVSGLARGDTIGLYGDPSGTSCNITDTSSLTYVYVVHVAPEGATASEFSAPKPACWANASFVYDVPQFPGLGGQFSQTGIQIGYGSCKVGAIHILTIVYSVQGPSEPRCAYPVLPVPWSPDGDIDVMDCYFNPGVAIGMVATVNGDATCPCGYPVPVEETTWGRMKALYEE